MKKVYYMVEIIDSNRNVYLLNKDREAEDTGRGGFFEDERFKFDSLEEAKEEYKDMKTKFNYIKEVNFIKTTLDLDGDDDEDEVVETMDGF